MTIISVQDHKMGAYRSNVHCTVNQQSFLPRSTYNHMSQILIEAEKDNNLHELFSSFYNINHKFN